MEKLRVLLVTGLVGLAACSSAAQQATPASLQPIAPATSPASSPETSATAVASSDVPNTDSPAATEASAAATTPEPPADDVYSQSGSWICRADSEDVCDGAAPLTEVAADGTLSVKPYTVADTPAVDCFYVYPTISSDATFNSDMTADSELGAVIFQAQRFNQVCSVYAPVYRSVTSAGLSGQVQPQAGEGWGLAYDDVLAAWRHYLAYDNDGRPVVLLSHSQGSFHLTKLLHDEIDPNPQQRSLVVSAVLAGASFQVGKGKDIGGDTQEMPLCRSESEFGCVITFQTYRDSDPPQPGALFGAPSANSESACVNPAALAGGPGVLQTSMPAGDWALTDTAAAKAITTPFMDLPGLISGECKVLNGYSYLAITVNSDPTDPRGDDIVGDSAPNWGLHGVDINLTQESLIAVVRKQSAAYAAANP